MVLIKVILITTRKQWPKATFHFRVHRGWEPVPAGNPSAQLCSCSGGTFVHTRGRRVSLHTCLTLHVCKILHIHPALLYVGLATCSQQPPLCCSHTKHPSPSRVSPWWKSVASLWRLIHVTFPMLNCGWANGGKGLIVVLITACQWHIPLHKMRPAQWSTHVCRLRWRSHHLKANVLLLTWLLTCNHSAPWKLLSPFPILNCLHGQEKKLL